MGRYSWVIKTLTDGRKKIGAIKGLCGMKNLWRGLCNNKNNDKSILTNINETLNQMQFSIPHPPLQTIFNIARLTQIMKSNIRVKLQVT